MRSGVGIFLFVCFFVHVEFCLCRVYVKEPFLVVGGEESGVMDLNLACGCLGVEG